METGFRRRLAPSVLGLLGRTSMETDQSYLLQIHTSVFSESILSHSRKTIVLELQHAQYYNVSVRAFNRLGQSINQALLRVRTDDVPVRKEGRFRCSLRRSR